MGFLAWFRPPRHLFVLFLASTLVPAMALVWLGWRMLDLDRSLARQHVHDRLEHAADLISGALARELDALEERLPVLLNTPPDTLEHQGAVVAALTSGGIDLNAGAPLLYVPARPARTEPPAALWAPGEAREFQHNDYEGAIVAFLTLSRSDDKSIRAGALVRLARNLRKSHRSKEALDAYAELKTLGDVAVSGEPAALIAQQARCSLLNELGDLAGSRHEATALVTDLERGRCHAGPLLTDEGFHNTGVSWGRDAGRFEVTGQPEDRGRFKTPSLRNVAVTSPYMHDGSIANLNAVIEFYDRGAQSNPNLDGRIRPLKLSEEERRCLVDYLRSLTGSAYAAKPH